MSLRGLALTTAASVLAALALPGCTSTSGRMAAAVRPCHFSSCGTDLASLKLVTAKQLSLAPDRVTVQQAEGQFGGAVLVWRAGASGKLYDCREGRDAKTGAVHYVDCRLSDGGVLKAFQ